MPNFLFSAYLSVGEESKQTRLIGMGDPARRTKKEEEERATTFLHGGRGGGSISWDSYGRRNGDIHNRMDVP